MFAVGSMNEREYRAHQDPVARLISKTLPYLDVTGSASLRIVFFASLPTW